MSLYICAGCFEEAHPMQTDEGIGSYEFWGAVYTDNRTGVASACCEDTILVVDDSTEPDGDVAPYSIVETQEVNYAELETYDFGDYDDYVD